MLAEEADIAPQWFAVRTPRTVALEAALAVLGVETFCPRERIRLADGRWSEPRPIVAHLLFIRTLASQALDIERDAREGRLPALWIYRYSDSRRLHPISQREMRLFMLLTAGDNDRCEVYHRDDFAKGDRVRVMGGGFEGYEGYVRKIRNDRRIVVEIKGVCALALPFIPLGLLSKVPQS